MSADHSGFTLIELMVVVAVVSILAAIAIPQYQNHVSRARASAAITELDGIKEKIAACVSEQQTKTGCDAGSYGIPTLAGFPATRNVLSVDSIADGTLTATTGATASDGAQLTYVGSINIHDSSMTWSNTGTTCNNVRGFKPGQGGCP